MYRSNTKKSSNRLKPLNIKKYRSLINHMVPEDLFMEDPEDAVEVVILTFNKLKNLIQ